jgi:hypothetical protein
MHVTIQEKQLFAEKEILSSYIKGEVMHVTIQEKQQLCCVISGQCIISNFDSSQSNKLSKFANNSNLFSIHYALV